MSKNFFQDVVPPEKRSIRNVPIMGSRSRKKMPIIENRPEPVVNREPVRQEIAGGYEVSPHNISKKPSRRGRVFAVAAVLLVAVFIFGMMTAFTSAKVDIVPKKETVSFNVAVRAEKNPPPSSGALKYEIIETMQEEEVEVPASGEEMAEKKASGTITIYNNFSSETQRLIARTRFETAEGLVFRIAESIVVPGKTANGPGSMDAVVYAEEAGEKYNIEKNDFTIPGFKSDAERYKGFYAKSKTDMTGGFVGRVKKVSQADKDRAIENLKSSLRESLDKSVAAEIPEGFTALEGSTIYEYKELGQVESSGSAAILKVEGKAYTVVFDKASLSAVISRQFLPEWQMPTELRDVSGITMTLEPGYNLSADTLPIKLIGTSDVYALVNGAEVAQNLSGQPKGNLNDVMGKFGGVDTAKATVRPVWKSSFPENTAKIHINIE